MRLTFGDWQFDVDIAATMAYSAAEASEHCDCAYCRNYYAAAESQLRFFLVSFGVDIEAPDELMPYDFPGEMQYECYYAVAGKILKEGKEPICAGEATILPELDVNLHINTGCEAPCFFLHVSVTLPWILEEPMEEVVSPANEPSFLKKMWNRLLSKSRETTLKS